MPQRTKQRAAAKKTTAADIIRRLDALREEAKRKGKRGTFNLFTRVRNLKVCAYSKLTPKEVERLEKAIEAKPGLHMGVDRDADEVVLFVEVSPSAWVQKYRPVPNPTGGAEYDWFSDKDRAAIVAHMRSHERPGVPGNRFVWTIHHPDEGRGQDFLRPGRNIVNTMGIILTEEPWPDGHDRPDFVTWRQAFINGPEGEAL